MAKVSASIKYGLLCGVVVATAILLAAFLFSPDFKSLTTTRELVGKFEVRGGGKGSSTYTLIGSEPIGCQPGVLGVRPLCQLTVPGNTVVAAVSRVRTLAGPREFVTKAEVSGQTVYSANDNQLVSGWYREAGMDALFYGIISGLLVQCASLILIGRRTKAAP